MTAKQFAQLSELVLDIKATGDSAIVDIMCRTLNHVLHEVTAWQEVET